MRAAVVTERGATPKVGEFREPQAAEGAVLIDVKTAGLGGWDVMGGEAYRLPVDFPMVLRGEGVGMTRNGRRVYFGERSVLPFGAWAEKTLVPAAEVWDVPADVSDNLAITMALAGTGAYVPLEQAKIQKGESVLVIGGTGALGQIALQLARKHFKAGKVVAAGRNRAALESIAARGLCDAIVCMGTEDDTAALKDAAGPGFDVVLDMVYGEPFLHALKATRWGSRLMVIGAQAGFTANVPLPDMLFRTFTCVGTGQRAPADRRAIWGHLLDIARKERLDVNYLEFTLDQAAEAWKAQAASPHGKVTARI